LIQTKNLYCAVYKTAFMRNFHNIDSLELNDLINFYQSLVHRYSGLIEFILLSKVLGFLLFFMIQIVLFVTKFEAPLLSLISYISLLVGIVCYVVQLLFEHYLVVLERKISLKSRNA